MVATIQPDCQPCIDRTAHTLRAILHGTSDDFYWQKLAASARQSALDMRVNLELELYPPGGYSDQRMASDIRNAVNAAPDNTVNALIVTIPSKTVADAVQYASDRGMPVFGLNSGYEEVSGRGGLMEKGAVKFFTAMNERLAGEKAAEYFLAEFGLMPVPVLPSSEIEITSSNSSLTQPSFTSMPSFSGDVTMTVSDKGTTGNNTIGISFTSASPLLNLIASFTGEADMTVLDSGSDGNKTISISFTSTSPLLNSMPTFSGEVNMTAVSDNVTSALENVTAFPDNLTAVPDSGADGNLTEVIFNERNLESRHIFTNALFISPLGEKNSAYQQRYEGYRDKLVGASNVTTTWYELNITSNDTIEKGLMEMMSGCKYQSVLVGSGKLATHVHTALRSNNCHTITTPTKMGTFDTSETIFGLISSQHIEFSIDQHNHMQGWSPVHFGALYASTGLVLSPPPDGVYLSGPAVFTKDDVVTDTLRVCTDDAFPVCPNTYGLDGKTASNCPCTVRKNIRIGGVVHGITTDEFWDTVFNAAEQGANDMGVDLEFDRFEPQESNEILYRKMSAKILSLCQGGVDGLFVSISDPMIADAVKLCTELDVPVMSINTGIEKSSELNLLHHVGMVEENAGYAAGFKMAALASFSRALCTNHAPHLSPRCLGFENAMKELGIEYVAQVDVPDDNIARFNALVERAVGESGIWEGYALLVGGQPQIPAAMELKKNHPGVVMGSFDINNILYDELESGNLLFGIDQQSYLQGYLPIPILTHAATTKQYFLDHAIESGPSFVTASPDPATAACVDSAYPVCLEHPVEDYKHVNSSLKAMGVSLFALQAATAVLFIAWMIRFRKVVVVKASQPEFLTLVATGCLMIASAILPLSIEGEYRYERDAITLEETDVPNEKIKRVDASCMAVPWLVCIGFVLTYSALVAKLHRVNEVMRNALTFRQAVVPRTKTAITVGSLLGTISIFTIFVLEDKMFYTHKEFSLPNAYNPRYVISLLAMMSTILITWQLVSPLRWEREVIETDYLTGFPTESVGRCTSEHFAAFAGSCACFIGLCLAYALRISYITRKMPIEFAESKYIAVSIFFLLQLLVLGVPILVIAWENRNAYFMVLSLILFLMSFGTTLLIFVPKIIAQRKSNVTSRSLAMSAARATMRSFSRRPNTVEAIRRRTTESHPTSTNGEG